MIFWRTGERIYPTIVFKVNYLAYIFNTHTNSNVYFSIHVCFHVLAGNKNLKISCLISCKSPLLKVKVKRYQTVQIIDFCSDVYFEKKKQCLGTHKTNRF